MYITFGTHGTIPAGSASNTVSKLTIAVVGWEEENIASWKCQVQLCFPMSKKDVQQGAHQLKVRAEGRRHILLSNQPAAAGAGREVHS